MNRERMHQLIEAYGADPARWPPHERVDAAVLQQADLVGPLRQARALQAALDAALPEPALPPRLRARLLQTLPTRSRPWWQELWLAMGGARLAGPAFACALSLGMGWAWLLPAASDGAFSDTELETYLALAWIDPADSEELP